jgi:NAD(P)-dependent dehydrogenase (short-subunit alcohol dehydrogenase family)
MVFIGVLCRAKYDRYGARIVRHITGADAYELAVRLSRRINDPPARSRRKDLFMSEVTVVIGAGQIGQAIARRVSAGKHVVLADLHQTNADAAAEVLANAGFDVGTATVDVSSRESVHALVETTAARGDITGVIHAAGVSPSQATPEVILAVDLYGTALVLEEFGNVIASGGAGVVIASQSGHRLGALTAQQVHA